MIKYLQSNTYQEREADHKEKRIVEKEKEIIWKNINEEYRIK